MATLSAYARVRDLRRKFLFIWELKEEPDDEMVRHGARKLSSKLVGEGLYIHRTRMSRWIMILRTLLPLDPNDEDILYRRRRFQVEHCHRIVVKHSSSSIAPRNGTTDWH